MLSCLFLKALYEICIFRSNGILLYADIVVFRKNSAKLYLWFISGPTNLLCKTQFYLQAVMKAQMCKKMSVTSEQ